MRITEIRAFHARIPFKKSAYRDTDASTFSETLIIRCRLQDGTTGWGESLPRPYETGETMETVWQHLSEFDVRAISHSFHSAADLTALVQGISMPRPQSSRDCFGNAARCALELAILDAGCRGLGISLSDFIRQLPEAVQQRHQVPEVNYSAVLPTSSLMSIRFRIWLSRLRGFQQFKVKVGENHLDERRLLRGVRNAMGKNATLRIDAGEAWRADEVLNKLNRLSDLKIASVEQPVPHAEVDQLRKIRRRSPIPIMLDTSLCSTRDAERAIEQELCHAFNIRLSKCGGILPSVAIARAAQVAELSAQLGSQFGETGILSAAGRHFASSISGLTAVEGSDERQLTREPLTREDLSPGRAGQGKALQGTGLAVTIDNLAVERVSQETFVIAVRR